MNYAARRFILFAGLGFLSTVGVALSSAMFVDPATVAPDEQRTMDEKAGTVWVMRRWSRWSATLVYSQRFTGSIKDRENPVDLAPYWSGFDMPVIPVLDAQTPYESRSANGHGWPLRALRSETEDPFSERRRVIWGVDAPRDQVARPGVPQFKRVLPLRPIPLGCLVNSLVFAAILYAPFLPFDVRRLLRRRRRQCLSCGYPAGASSRCTECGRPLED